MDQPRSIKLQLMVSAAELEAIDAWRFEHRVASRAEAVRRLVRTGLGTAQKAARLAPGH